MDVHVLSPDLIDFVMFFGQIFGAVFGYWMGCRLGASFARRVSVQHLTAMGRLSFGQALTISALGLLLAAGFALIVLFGVSCGFVRFRFDDLWGNVIFVLGGVTSGGLVGVWAGLSFKLEMRVKLVKTGHFSLLKYI